MNMDTTESTINSQCHALLTGHARCCTPCTGAQQVTEWFREWNQQSSGEWSPVSCTLVDVNCGRWKYLNLGTDRCRDLNNFRIKPLTTHRSITTWYKWQTRGPRQTISRPITVGSRRGRCRMSRWREQERTSGAPIGSSKQQRAMRGNIPDKFSSRLAKAYRQTPSAARACLRLFWCALCVLVYRTSTADETSYGVARPKRDCLLSIGKLPWWFNDNKCWCVKKTYCKKATEYGVPFSII